MEETEPRTWRPLTSRQRRIVGVLIEKAKTTPDAYPMTLNGLTTGCNQKSNRSPQMELTPDDVEAELEELRQYGAVVEVQGGGRVAKYRHRMYEWLGVDKVELAVMAELLLRGEQTVGELRGRAARMEPIADLNTLRPVLESLESKQLLISLTSAGRGQVVTHALYPPKEREQLQAGFAAGPRVASDSETESAAPASSGPAKSVSRQEFDDLLAEIQSLRDELNQLKERLP